MYSFPKLVVFLACGAHREVGMLACERTREETNDCDVSEKTLLTKFIAAACTARRKPRRRKRPARLKS